MRAEISGLKVNVSNAEQASNLLQVAEGCSMRSMQFWSACASRTVQSSSSTVTDQNRESIQAEFSQLTQEIDRIAQATIYNNQTPLTGFGNTVNGGSSTAVSTSNATGVTDVRISGAESVRIHVY